MNPTLGDSWVPANVGMRFCGFVGDLGLRSIGRSTQIGAAGLRQKFGGRDRCASTVTWLFADSLFSFRQNQRSAFDPWRGVKWPAFQALNPSKQTDGVSLREDAVAVLTARAGG